MRGHEQLVDMRLRGRIPSGVHIRVDEQWPVWATRDWHVPTHHGGSVSAFVVVSEADAIDRLDLRFVVGLAVQVGGSNAARVRALGLRCSEEGAVRVVVSSDDWTVDTEGVLTWQP